MYRSIVRTSAAAFIMAAMVASGASAQATAGDERDRALEAAEVLRELTRVDETGIPANLLDRAHAIAVIPDVVRGAFIIGGRYGKGLVTSRTSSGEWGPPAFVNIGGASYGFQIGADATDLVMIFTEKEGLEKLLADKLELGADASVAAGPVGRSAAISTNATFDSAIYSYSRTKGAFAGVALTGAVLTIDDSANEEAYGREITGREILIDQRVEPAPVTQPFLAAVREATKED